MSTKRHDHDSDDPDDGPARERGQESAADHAADPVPERAADRADPAAQDPRERPRGSRLTVAVVAAAVLLAGGGGAYWAASSGGGGHGGTASQPLRVDGPGVPSAMSGGDSVPASGGDDYLLTGALPKGPKSAAVYRTSGGVDQAAVRRLAGLLGLTGPVESLQGSWRVLSSTAEGGGPALLVSKDAPGAWSYTRYGSPPPNARPDGTASSGSPSSRLRSGTASGTASGTTSGAASSVPGPGTSTSGVITDTVTSPTRTGGAGPATEQKAKASATPVLNGLGLSGARIDAAQTVGSLRMVTADPVVGGLPTHGWATTLQVGADGRLTAGYGRLSALAKGDAYPVVDAAKALKELNAVPIAHPAICAAPFPVPVGPAAPAGPTGTAVPTLPAPTPTPSADGKSPNLRDTRPCPQSDPRPEEVRSARFGLATQSVSGTQALVPAWLFDTAQAGVTRTSVVAQIAVDPAYIASTGPGGPWANSPGGPSPIAPATPGGPVRVDPVHPVDPQAPRPVPLTSYRASGSTLTVVFWGGVCSAYHAAADETGSRVRVRVTETSTRARTGMMCPMIAKSMSRTVTLKQPLGGRTVVDASDGRPVRGQ